jgi:hypothetical protein
MYRSQKRGTIQVALNRLWERLSPGDRQEIAQIIARMIAAQILPATCQEGSDEA